MSERTNTEYFRPAEAKQVIGVSRSTIYKWAKEGLITLRKHGGMTFVSMKEVRQILEPMGD